MPPVNYDEFLYPYYERHPKTGLGTRPLLARVESSWPRELRVESSRVGLEEGRGESSRVRRLHKAIVVRINVLLPAVVGDVNNDLGLRHKPLHQREARPQRPRRAALPAQPSWLYVLCSGSSRVESSRVEYRIRRVF